jgi:hypothetical protein
MPSLEDSHTGAVLTNALLSSPTCFLNEIKLERVGVLEKCPLSAALGRSLEIFDSTQAARHAPSTTRGNGCVNKSCSFSWKHEARSCREVDLSITVRSSGDGITSRILSRPCECQVYILTLYP